MRKTLTIFSLATLLIVSTPNTSHALSPGVTFNPTATTQTTAAINVAFAASNVSAREGTGEALTTTDPTARNNDGESILNVWDINIASTCYPYVRSVTSAIDYTSTDYAAYGVGAITFVGDGPTLTPWGTAAVNNGDLFSSFPGALSIQAYEQNVGSTTITGPETLSGTWSSTSGPSVLQIVTLAEGQWPNWEIASVSITPPTVNVVFTDTTPHSCDQVVPNVTTTNLSASIAPTTAADTAIIDGSLFGVSNAKQGALTYSLSAPSDYFAIDSTTGTITTRSGAIPTGQYVLGISVSDEYGGSSSMSATVNVGSTQSPNTANSTSGGQLAATGIDTYGIIVMAAIGIALSVTFLARRVLYKIR